MIIKNDIKYVGVNDHKVDLFEGIYKVPKGMSYNSYVIMDEKIAILDTVDVGFEELWLENLQNILQERRPDYLIIQHMEPDHSANIVVLLERYPEIMVVASAKAFEIMENFFGRDFVKQRLIIADGDKLSLGKHKLVFVAAPMVHWPEVMMTYDSTDKVFFSADAFGKFGALDIEDEWLNEARRYYFGIVGKYGVYVQKLLKKVSQLDIQMICPLHGPVLSDHLELYLEKYDTWSRYEPEEEGVLIAYTSIYGNTKSAALLLVEKLTARGCKNIMVCDLARCDMSEAVAQAFRYSRLVLASSTYNAGIFPFMREFIQWLTERYYRNRLVGFIENGSWAIVAAKIMREMMEKCKDITFAENTVRIVSAVKEENIKQLELLAEELCNAGDGRENNEICM